MKINNKIIRKFLYSGLSYKILQYIMHVKSQINHNKNGIT